MDMKSVESVQRRATKLIPELREQTYQERLKALKLPSLVYRRRRFDMIVMYKIQHGMLRIDSTDLFTPLEFSRTRGHQYLVYKGSATKQQACHPSRRE